MNHHSHTPLDLDHVLHVIGKHRFISQLHLPVADWDLTPDEIDRLKRGPHHARFTLAHDTEAFGIVHTLWEVECDCGATFTNRLLSAAIRAHEDHAHLDHVNVRPVHTADILTA